MSEEECHEDVDISDITEHSESYLENEHLKFALTEATEAENNKLEFELNSEEQVHEKKQKTEVIRSTKLPIARIKNIMKMDPDVNIVSSDAVFLVTKATEMFLETIVKETYAFTSSNKRKVISKKDLELVIDKVDCLCFLEGAMDF
ncbi:DNA polymerase epsilon subunit 4 [Bombyx mandarina]|uniref:DNA polymerase epsilon subunit 4 n=1 Tax=Bombyx mandarina TaxID=7092 RepID=A0A6J2KQ56_BOMMA|nr:DNA polymerase epsilon subunit 4 [Bombyx mandarina]